MTLKEYDERERARLGHSLPTDAPNHVVEPRRGFLRLLRSSRLA